MACQYFGGYLVDIVEFELVFAPIDSWDLRLSIGAKSSLNRQVDLELWRGKVDTIILSFNKK